MLPKKFSGWGKDFTARSVNICRPEAATCWARRHLLASVGGDMNLK